jgi:hypothetical protein
VAQRDTVQLVRGGVAKAEAELSRFETEEANKIRAWVASGCESERPSPDAATGVKLVQALAIARQAETAAGPALEDIQAEISAWVAGLTQIRAEIEAAACQEMVADFL